MIAWIANGLAVWFAVSVPPALWVGRMVRARDRQIPR